MVDYSDKDKLKAAIADKERVYKLLCDKHNAALLIYQMAQPNGLKYVSMPQIDELLSHYHSCFFVPSHVTVQTPPKCNPLDLYSRLAEALLMKIAGDKAIEQLWAEASAAPEPQSEDGLTPQLMSVFYGKVAILRTRQIMKVAVQKVNKDGQLIIAQAEYLGREAIQELRDLHMQTGVGILLTSDRHLSSAVKEAEGEGRFKDLSQSWYSESGRKDLEHALSLIQKDFPNSSIFDRPDWQILPHHIQQISTQLEGIRAEIHSLKAQEREMEAMLERFLSEAFLDLDDVLPPIESPQE